MTNFPSSLDDDTTLPFVNDNITEIGGDAINALRDAVFAIEQNIGIGAEGASGSISARLGISINPDGSIKPSAIASMGLVTLPITQDQIADFAQIPESKLRLDHRTQDLYNYIKDLSTGINTSLGWISTTGVKLDPHLLGVVYRHTLSEIDVSSDTDFFLKNKFALLRDNTNSYSLINDINNELLFHQFADGSPVIGTLPIITNDGSTYPSNYGHTSSGIWLNSSRFAIIPQTVQDLQAFADFIDNSSILLYGTRIQNFYSNGISRVSRSSSLVVDGYGSFVVEETPAIAYLLNLGNNSSPFDNIDTGDDIIEFKPTSDSLSSNSFDEQFALVRVGDIIRINYGSIEVPFIIKEKKYRQAGGVKKFIIRIAGKNLFYAPNATARIDRSLVNANKYGVLAVGAANNFFAEVPSLIVGNSRGAQSLGLGFNIDQFDQTHYNLYLALFATGNPADGYTLLPAIDVTGNQGVTPGRYTLDSIIESTNAAFRQVGYNYRFLAFSYQGEFGIMLADSYNNAGFSILNGVVDGNGFFSQTATALEFPNNVVDVFATDGYTPVDPLGFGINGSGIASPPFMSSYPSAEAALQATKLFLPLKRNNYYVNGVEKEKLNLEIDQVLDSFGDGYWAATINSTTSFPGAPPTGRVETTYRILLDLSSSGLKSGKTLVIQSLGAGSLTDFGRFTIKTVEFNVCAPNIYTDITVYDAVHATGISPVTTLGVGGRVALYFNSDSVSFNKETATDFNNYSPFKRHFEIFINSDGNTFSHERGRVNISGSTMTINDSISLFGGTELNKLNIIKISPKLRGYQFGSVNKITLRMLSYDESLGVFDGYLSSYDGVTFTHPGPITTGRKGQITRFYDETFNDYIDILFDINVSVTTFVDRVIDFQLFPTLSLDDEIMMIATCQLNDVTNTISQLRDERQFGNTSEKDLSTSALNFISLPERLLHSNGVIRGFDLSNTSANPNTSQIYFKGGVCLVNGKVIQINDETVTIPPLKETIGLLLFNVNWIICINDRGEYQPIPLLDSDSNASTPTNPSRIFRGYNIVSGQSYNLDATTFSDLINNRKDLTPLYIVRSVVTAGTPPIFDLSIIDARKYINDADSNLPLRLTTEGAQGNFRSVESILTWIRFNGQFNGVAYVKGATIGTGVIEDDITLTFNNTIIFDGENNSVLTFNGHVTLGSHVTFKDVSIIFNGGVTILPGSTNINFDRCIINYNSNLEFAASNDYAFHFNGCSLVKFTDSVITASYSQVVVNSAVINIEGSTNCSIDDCLINVTFSFTPGDSVPADVFWLVNSPGVSITSTNAFGNFNKYINNINSSGMQVKNFLISSSYDPTLDGIYDTRDVVNSGNGYIYSNVSGLLDAIVIENGIFNYAPSVASENRYSFINFELSSVTATLSNCKITGCNFVDFNTGAALDGYRAAVSIINITTAVAAPNFQPFAYNVNISNNICNKNQAIVISSKTLTDGYTFDGYFMGYPGLAAVNVVVQNNICGTIGYWVSSGTKVINLPGLGTPFVDKSSSLTINNNTCHYIASMTSKGQYFRSSRRVASGGFSDTINASPYPSGYVTISNNTANWIHTAISFEEDSALYITDNTLTAYDQNYLGNGVVGPRTRYSDDLISSFLSGVTQGVNMAISVSCSAANISPFGIDGSVIIRGNSTNAGYFYYLGFLPIAYTYSGGYIYCQASNNISENFLRGYTAAGSGYGILVGGLVNYISQNKIYRGAGPWTAYVSFYNPDSPALNYSFTRGTVVDNFFDSPFINNLANDRIFSGFPATAIRWIFDRNINQTVYVSIPITNSQLIIAGFFANYEVGSFDKFVTTAPPPTASTFIGYKSNTLWIHNATTDNISYHWQENLTKYLRPGSRLIEVKMGVKVLSNTSLTLDSSSYVAMFLNTYTDPTNSTDLTWATATTVADPHIANASSTNTGTNLPPLAPTGTQAYATLGGSNPFAIGTAQTLDIITENINGSGTDISDQFIAVPHGYTGSSSPATDFGISISCAVVKGGGGTSLDVYLSPIMVKYRW